jgi:glutamate N-acetyltransferase/amino-acid N-acetyltransferase
MSNDSITAPQGFRAGAAACGIKVEGKLDVGVVVADEPCAAAAVFTTNRFCGCPVTVGREHIRRGKLRAFVVNSGCSNVATGERGLRDARAMCAQIAAAIGCDAREVLPSSTGLIGAFLPMDKVQRGIADAVSALSDSAHSGHDFARAIMTTDTRPKETFEQVKIGKSTVRIAGCCKGSGMIAPNMATMLAYITTDAGVAPAVLRRLLRQAADRTFNRVTVDECPSTSDTVAIMASGRAAVFRSAAEQQRFSEVLLKVCESLSYQIVKDGEGATRVLEVVVTGAKSPRDAHATARAVAVSPLVKTAVHGGDPNWGRIVQALGATSVRYEPDRVVVSMLDHSDGRKNVMPLFKKGAPSPKLDRARLSSLMRQPHVTVAIDLGAGRCEDRVLTCDLSREYVTINADYST